MLLVLLAAVADDEKYDGNDWLVGVYSRQSISATATKMICFPVQVHDCMLHRLSCM